MENPFEIIIEKLNNIEKQIKLLQANRANSDEPLSNTNEIMNLEQVAKYINQSKSAVYKHTSSRAIPHFKSAKRVYFKKTEIDTWLTKNKIMTADEIDKIATDYIIRKGKVWK